jgi:hypothetical protein
VGWAVGWAVGLAVGAKKVSGHALDAPLICSDVDAVTSPIKLKL